MELSGSGNENTRSIRSTSTGRAVMLLALFVVLGVALLQTLDNTPASVKAKNTSASDESAAVTSSTTSTTQAVAKPAAQVQVLVANGTQISGAAAKIALKLQPMGYQLAKPTDTLVAATTSQIQYAPGYKADAERIATVFNIATANVVPIATPSPVADLGSANVVVVAAEDLARAAAGSSTASNSATGLSEPTGPLASSNSSTTTSSSTTSSTFR